MNITKKAFLLITQKSLKTTCQVLAATATLTFSGAAVAQELDTSLQPGSWSLVILPDTQYYSEFTPPEVFLSQTQWIAANQDEFNIQFVLHEGDIVQNNVPEEWENARQAMSILSDTDVPYALAVGNHDMGDNGTANNRNTLVNNYFSLTDYVNSETVGYYQPNRLENTYHTFSAGGEDYIVLSLEFGPRDEVVDWADQVLSDYPERTGILLTHAYMYSDDTRYDWQSKGESQFWNPHAYGVANLPGGVHDGEELWQRLVRKHENMAFVFSGHVLNDGTGLLTSIGDNGNVVHQILANYQRQVDNYEELGLGGGTYLRLLEFLPDNETVQVRTYSPYFDEYLTDDDQQFTLSLASEQQPASVPDPSAGILTLVGLSNLGILSKKKKKAVN